MPSTIDIRAYSKQLLDDLQHLDTLIERLSTGGGDDLGDVAKQSQAIVESLGRTRSGLQAAAEAGPIAVLNPASSSRAIAVSVAELPLESALQVLGELPQLVMKIEARSTSAAVLLVPLCLAYRHCVEALSPLAAALDPRDLVS